VLALAVLPACTGDPKSGDRPPGSTPLPRTSAAEDPAGRAAAVVATLSDEDLVGQVFMPYAYGGDATKVSAGSASGNRSYAGVSTPAEMITKYRLGGLILVGFSADDPTAGTNRTTNVDNPAQVRALTRGMQTAAATLKAEAPLLIGIDQEYGQVTRIKDGMIQLPSAIALGAAADPRLTEAAWRAGGTELAALGINVDFAPVADVLGDRPGGVIGSRAFGSDPAAVAAQVAASVRGMQAAGVAATLKHFPGHGHTTVDSHTSLPVLAQDRAGLDAGDLPPFKSGIEAGAGLIMSGHLDVRAIDAGTPASFSSKILVDLLRKELGFTGVVVTDAMNMAPARRGTPGAAAVAALIAGNDILLMPPNLTQAHKGVLDALRGGQLPRARLVEAVTRILTLKFRLAATPQPDPSTVNSEPNRAAALAMAAAGVTVLRGACDGRLVSGTVRVTAAGKWDRQRQWLEAALKSQGLTVAAGGSQVHLVGYGDNAGDLDGAAAVTVAMDTPYVLASARSGTRLATYSSTQVAMEALAAVLAGKAKAPGRSPVAINGLPRSACAR
jgi:beta-N-acetylhexosaminidase